MRYFEIMTLRTC